MFKLKGNNMKNLKLPEKLKSVISDVTGDLIASFVLNWLITKGVIWVSYELFNINWYGKFWAVYVLCWIVGTMLKKKN